MGTRLRLVDFLGFTPLAHRPPLPRRWWVYCAVAYLAPSLVLQFVASEEVPYRDLIWLLTLVPAYLLSLTYGLRGAVAGLVMGTVLFRWGGCRSSCTSSTTARSRGSGWP
ncbi:MAG: hypothetical protein DMD28_02830 [Gemmatimonadetes bacterium]|nr:MAG: hypothetical protein DMD28_02830 [Gemmatimonadota bacterium]